MTTPRRVMPRDVWTVLWVTSVFVVALLLLWQIRRILVWILVAAFFATVLSPLVAWLVRRRLRRGVAVALVALGLVVVVAGLTFLFVKPLVTEAVNFAEDLPQTVERIQRAPVVRQFVERFDIEGRIDEVSQDLPKRLVGLSGPILSAFRTFGELVVGLVTIFVLTIFLLLYGPQFVKTGVELIRDPARRARVERVGSDVARAVSGWVAGNVITSFIAGIVSFVVLAVVGVPYAALLGLWVFVADLIPLVGATLGAIPAVIVAFLDSTVAGIIVLAFFILYQQFENHVLQPAVYGRTIKLNPFLVLVAVLIGVEVAGFLGALFALPVAGAIQVIVMDVMANRRGIGPTSPGEMTPGPPEGGTARTELQPDEAR